MKNIVKFKFEDREGFLSVVESDDFYYALVQKDTPKVKEILKTNRLWISYELKTPNYQEVSVQVSFDQKLIAWVYDELKAQNNLYFKALDDSLCILKIVKE